MLVLLAVVVSVRCIVHAVRLSCGLTWNGPFLMYHFDVVRDTLNNTRNQPQSSKVFCTGFALGFLVESCFVLAVACGP